MAQNTNNNAAAGAAPNFLPLVIFGNCLVLQVALYFILLVRFDRLTAPLPILDAEHLAPAGGSDPLLLGTYAAGILSFIMAFASAKFLLRASQAPGQPKGISGIRLPGSGSGHPLSQLITPYIVRMCLCEFCSMAGLVLGIARNSPSAAIPLIGLGLVATLLSVPSPTFFARFGGRTT